MTDENQIKNEVRKNYAAIVSKGNEHQDEPCCAPSCCGGKDTVSFADNYKTLEGYLADADLKLGCGIPTKHAAIRKGDTVLDLGSGAGNDCFVARSIVGEEGKIIGVDMTYEMIIKARQNNNKMGYENVEFRLGEIEYLPVDTATVDVVVSNCVLNLVPNKKRAFQEMHRVLKPGGHFSVSDIVVEGDLPDYIRNDIAAYAGCISGAVSKSEYLKALEEAGFTNIQVKSEKKNKLPENLTKGINESGAEILSISVYGEK